MNTIRIFTDGLRGFAVVFSIILAIKMLLFLFGATDLLNIEIMDIYHSFVGFILMIVTAYTRNLIRE